MGYLHKFVLLATAALLTHSALAADTLAEAKKLESSGDFKKASAVIREALKGNKLPETTRRDLQWELDWMERVRQDYSWTEDKLFQRVSNGVKGVTREEFNAWLKEGRFDGRKIDGEMQYTTTSLSNLFWRHPDLNERRQPPKDLSHYHESLLDTARRVKTATEDQKKPFVMPTHFKCTMTVTAAKNATKNGETIRAWLPVPRKYDYQSEFNLLNSSSPVQYLSHEDSPIRSAYLVQKAIKDQPTKFQITYEYVRNGIYFHLQPNEVKMGELNAEVMRFTQPAPHVVFTPQIKALAREIAGTEKNPLLQARSFYNWISEHIQYSFAREYSTLTNISDYCYSHGYGDCGQEALLFITLCRSQGIPARWQSGWNIFPGQKDIHDWTEIYIAPYGWVPVDPWAGIYAMGYCKNLSEEERRELRDFYFGGLDQYRMAANCDHSQNLQPPKKNFRSDNVDFQRGELEASQNIYFDKYSYDLDVEEITTAK